MISASLAASIFAGLVSCDATIDESSKKVNWQHHNVTFDTWPSALCVEHQGEYEKLEFHIVTERHSNRDRSYGEEEGTLSISNIRAGRVRVSWRSQSNNDGFTVWLKTVAKKPTWIAKKRIAPGAIIGSRDITYSTVDVGPTLGTEDTAVEDPIGKMTLRAISKNTVISKSAVSDPPLVNQSDDVKILLRSGLLQITSPGKALSTGWKNGDTVSILVDNSDAPTSGIVIGEGHVYIEI